MDTNIKAVPGGFQDKIKGLLKAQHGVAEVGWFSEQGTHVGSGLTYPDLAKVHATGQGGVTVRDVLRVALLHYKGSKKPEIKKAVKAYLLSGTSGDLDNIVESLGESYWNKVRWAMGNPMVLPVTQNLSPLVDTGELKNNLARRTDKNTVLKTN